MSPATPRVPTVTGEAPVSDLGVVLPHEHLIHRISIHSGRDDNTCLDTELVAEELTRFKQAGGGTVCDVTPLDVGRNPAALREISQRSGVNVVSALGLYSPECLPGDLSRMSERELADFLVREAAGESTGIRAGFLGEIASHNEGHGDWRRYRLRDEEVKVFHAVAEAQRRTGLFISTHASLGRPGVAQLEALTERGGDPSRVVIGHCDAQGHDDIGVDLDYFHRLLARGAMLEFDLFGWEDLLPEARRVERVAALVAEGHVGRLLVSTDTCRLSHLRRNGGRGFDYLFTSVLPALREAGLAEADLHRMTVANPAKLLGDSVTGA